MMNNTKPIFVVLGVDSHLNRIEKCLSTIKLVYGDNVDIGVATFGNSTVPPSSALKEFSSKNGYTFYDSDRQDFIELSSNNKSHSSQPAEVSASGGEFHVCETLGNLAISKHYYDLGYEEVYLLHSDLFVIRDFLPMYRKRMVSNWAFVSAYLSDPTLPKPDISLFASQNDIHNGNITVGGNKVWIRMAQAVLILNKALVNALFDKYATQKDMFDLLLSKYSMYGDIALAQIAAGLEGFAGNPVIEDTMIDSAATLDVSRERLLNDEKATHIHGAELYNKYYDSISTIINQIAANKK